MQSDLAVPATLFAVLLLVFLTALAFRTRIASWWTGRVRVMVDPFAALGATERAMAEGVLRFPRTVVREVMTPRIDLVAVPVDISLPELLRTVLRERYSRLPVYEGTIDTVVGVLLVRDLLPLLAGPARGAGRRFDLRALMRQPYFVPDAKPAREVLEEFRRQSIHLAIVLDEFGGTYGLVTIDDLVAEIVGEIRDEHDVAEPDFAETADGDALIDGGAAVSEVNERFGLTLSEEDYDTVGGFVFGQLGRVPEVGDQVQGVEPGGELALQVEEIEDRRIVRLRLIRPRHEVTAAG